MLFIYGLNKNQDFNRETDDSINRKILECNMQSCYKIYPKFVTYIFYNFGKFKKIIKKIENIHVDSGNNESILNGKRYVTLSFIGQLFHQFLNHFIGIIIM